MLKATSIFGIIGLLAAVSVPASAQGKGKTSKPEARTGAASAKRAVPPALLAQGPRVDRDITFTIAGNVVVAMRRDVVVDILRNVF